MERTRVEVNRHALSVNPKGKGPRMAVALEDASLRLAVVSDATEGLAVRDAELGAAAAQLAVDMFRAELARFGELLTAHAPQEAGWLDRLRGAMVQATGRAAKEVYALSRRRDRPLQVSFDAAVVHGGRAVVVHVGQGAVKLLRKGLVHHITSRTDGSSTPFPAEAAPRGPSASLGPDGSVVPEVAVTELLAGDRLLLLSPGVAEAVDAVRARELGRDPAADGVVARLVGAASDGTRPSLAAAIIQASGELEEVGGGRLATLARVPLFAWCTEPELVAIAGHARPVRLSAGAVVFTEGEQGTSVYLLVAGKVEVVKRGRPIARLGVGSTFGEMAMLDTPTRSADIRVVEDSEVLELTRESFFALLKGNPTLAVKVLWNLSLRISSNLRTTSERLAHATDELRRQRTSSAEDVGDAPSGHTGGGGWL